MTSQHNFSTMKQQLLLFFFALTFSFIQAQPLDWIWAHHYGGLKLDRIHDIDIDQTGALYVAGYFQDSILTSNGYVVGQGMEDILIAKLDSSNGEVIWQKTIGGSMQDFALGISCDGDGNCFVSGIVSGTGNIDFDGIPVNIGTIGSEMFLAYFDSGGQIQWVQTIGGTGNTENAVLGDMEVDANGNCLVTGYFFGTVDFNGQTVSINGSSSSDIFLARFSPSGTLDWISTTGDGDMDQAHALTISDTGYVYQTGHFRGSPVFWFRYP
jgi:hypothetical protein